jgi:hypothetical protein
VVFHPLQKDSNGTVLRGFPKDITSSYGGYEKTGGTGKKRGDWKPKPTKQSYPIRNIPLPSADEHSKLLINSAGAMTIWQHLGGPGGPFSLQIPRYIAGKDSDGLNRTTVRYRRTVEDTHPPYRAVSDVRRYLEARRSKMPRGSMRDIYRVISKLKELDRADKIDWLK